MGEIVSSLFFDAGDFEKDFVAGYTQFGTIGFGGSENADGSGEAFD